MPKPIRFTTVKPNVSKDRISLHVSQEHNDEKDKLMRVIFSNKMHNITHINYDKQNNIALQKSFVWTGHLNPFFRENPDLTIKVDDCFVVPVLHSFEDLKY
jgi:hypothetical protein